MTPNKIFKLFFSIKKSLFFFIIIYPIFSSPEILFLKQKVFLEKKELLLSDVVRLNSKVEDSILVSNLEEVKVFYPEDINNLLGKNLDIRGNRVVVLPLNESFDREEIRLSLEKEFLKEFQLKEELWKISYLGDNLKLPSSGVDIKWNLKPIHPSPGQKILSLDLFFDKEKIYSFKLKFLFEEKKTAYFLNKDISKGKILREEDLSAKDIFVSENSNLLSIDKILNYSASFDLSKNTQIQKKHIRTSFLIERGSNVDLVFTKGSLFVKAKGIAKNSANEGQIVKVLSSSNQAIIAGRALDKGVVVVE